MVVLVVAKIKSIVFVIFLLTVVCVMLMINKSNEYLSPIFI